MTGRAHTPVILVVLMAVTAAAMLLPAAVGFTLREHALARAFLYSSVLLGGITTLLYLATRAVSRVPRSMAHPFSILTLTYFLLPCLMAIPLTEAVPGISFGDAWFEMLSAFTTTGASVLEGEVSRSLHLWRATVSWGGGLFILVSVMALLAPLNLGGVELFRGQFSDGTSPVQDFRRATLGEVDAQDRTLQRLRDQVRLVAPFYTGLTLLLWVALSMAGNPPLIALMLAMSTVSTSAIAPEGALTSVLSESLIACVMVFALSRRFWPGARALAEAGSRKRHDPELLLATGVITIVVGAMVFRSVFVHSSLSFSDQLAMIWAHGFTALSFLTTTGFVSTASGGLETVFSGPSGMVALGLALFGGGVATTAGGLKLLRIVALGWQAQREVSKLVYPESIGGDGPRLRALRREGAFSAWLFLMIFIFSLTILSATLTISGLTLEDALVFSVAALTTTGPLPEIAASAPLQWTGLSDLQKTLLGVGMLMGRLELLLLISVFWRR